MKQTIIIFLTLTLSACMPTNTVVKVAPGYEKEVNQTSFSFIDNRPEEEISGGRVSLLSPADRIGEGNLSYPPILVFKNKIHNRYGEKLSGKTITIDHFEIINSYPKSNNSTTAASLASLSYVAALLVDSQKHQIEDSVICHVEGNVNGKKFKLAKMQPYYLEKMIVWSVFESENFKSSLSNVINQCIDGGIKEIKYHCDCGDT